MRALLLTLALSIVASLGLAAQTPASPPPSAVAPADAPRAERPEPLPPVRWIGATLDLALRELGAPESVYAVRGLESWQDDVVFRYQDLELFWFRDRVWQVRAKQTHGLRVGESADKAAALLGEPLERTDSSLIYQLTGTAWPQRLRVNLSPEGYITELYLYRSDF